MIAILYWASFNSAWPAWTCSEVCQRLYSLFLLSSPPKTDGGGWRTTDRMFWLYIPEQLLTDSLNKSGRNNDWEATNTAWTSPVILYINERNLKSYQDEEGRGHVDREVSKKTRNITMRHLILSDRESNIFWIDPQKILRATDCSSG